MDQELVFQVLAAIIIHYCILAWIISSCTSNARKNRHLEAQTRLLAKIAKHQGVPESEIAEITQYAVFETGIK